MEKDYLEKVSAQSKSAFLELIENSNITGGDVIVIGCSSSEVVGEKIGTNSSSAAANAIWKGMHETAKEKDISLAVQCCEHLNRCLIVEGKTAEKHGLEIVYVIPKPEAGGAFATAAFENFINPVAVEFIKAKAGLDIGGTMIGMHIKHVAVPLRLEHNKIGETYVTGAVYRPKLIGGERARYD